MFYSSVCSVEDDGSGRPTISIDAVPDVAADAEERSAGSSPRRTPGKYIHVLNNITVTTKQCLSIVIPDRCILVGSL